MEEWYEQHFQADYLRIYDHRDEQEAERAMSHLYSFLGTQDGQRVLDLCCGEGRHSRWLAGKGLQVVGVDLSPVLLQEAINKTLNLPIFYMRADAREIDFKQEFELVVNMFTSFGYFDDDKDNEKVIRKVSQALKPGGIFLLDYMNPDYVKQTLDPFTKTKKEDLEIWQYRSVTENRVQKDIIVKEGDDERRYTEKVQLYSPNQIKGMLDRNGLDVIHEFGDYEGSPFDVQASPRMIVISRKVD